MKEIPKLILLVFLVYACRQQPAPWQGPVLTQPRQVLTVAELLAGTPQALIDLSYFAQPQWASPALTPFSGTLQLEETELNFPKAKAYYPGENLFPHLLLDFISHEGALIPLVKERISTRFQNNSFWDVILGTGKVWHEAEDQEWSRASFPLTLTDRYAGQARNCVVTFVYTSSAISQLCLQCSQETADIDDQQLGNISAMIPASYAQKPFADSTQIIERHRQAKSSRLPTAPLREIDQNHKVADFFEKTIHTNAPTSLGALLLDGQLYLHPAKTRHGLYPYPEEMRHGLYSVTKSMAGALALMYFEERYQGEVFPALITDYVPALAQHEGWQGVTFSHTLNMVTGTVGSERLEHFFSTVIAAETAAEAIHNIAALGDAPALPGQHFNYASANLLVLSYALQQLVAEKEGAPINYWDLVRENVLVPIGAANFNVLHTREKEETQAIPVLALGALPTIDEAAKIALLFANGGRHNGRQLLHRKRVLEVFGDTAWDGHSTHDDFRGTRYQHSFWSQTINTWTCQVKATYMLGFGENYVVFLPSGAIVFRFLDEHDLNIKPLVKRVEKLKSSCQEN